MFIVFGLIFLGGCWKVMRRIFVDGWAVQWSTSVPTWTVFYRRQERRFRLRLPFLRSREVSVERWFVLLCVCVGVCGWVWVRVCVWVCVSFYLAAPLGFWVQGSSAYFFLNKSVSTNNRFVSFTHTHSLSLCIYMTQNYKVFASGARNGWIS